MDAVCINRSLSIYTARVKDEWGVSGSVTNFAQRTTVLGFLGGARLQERLKCQEGGAGCQKCMAAQPVVWREGWVEDRDSLPAARGMLQIGTGAAEKTSDRGGKCVSSQWESLCSQG